MLNDNGMLNSSSAAPSILSHLSWTAIFIGTIIGFSLSFLLDLLGLALGLSLFSTTNTGATFIALGGMVSILIGLVATMLATGYATGYLGRIPKAQRKLGIFYGLTTWGLILLLNILLAIPINHYISSFTAMLYPSETVASDTRDLNLDNVLPGIQSIDSSINNPSSSPSATSSPKLIAESAFIIFSLFLVGAFSTCAGACWALGSKQHQSEKA